MAQYYKLDITLDAESLAVGVLSTQRVEVTLPQIGPAGPRGIQGEVGPVGPVGQTGSPGADGREVELQTTETHVQWRYEGESEWTDLVALSAITGPQGEQGETGLTGAAGADGREVELRKTETHVQWRYEDEAEWTDLVALSEITGPPGETGDQGPAGPANTLAIGTVTTGAAGTEADATVTGDSPAQTLNLVIPRGDKGDTGDQGPPGTATTDASDLTTGTLADARLSSNVPLLDAANTFSANQTFSGTNNVMPNQTTAASGSSLMTRALADNRLLDNLFSGKITKYTLTAWRTVVTGGGAVRTWPDVQGGLALQTGATGGTALATASGSINGGIFVAQSGGDTRFINYSNRVRVFVKFSEVLGFSTNCFYYFHNAQAAGGSPAIGDPTTKSIGFKVVHLSGNNGSLLGVVHDGTTLSTSSSFSAVNNRVPQALLIDSLGNGTVNYYLDGTLVGTMTGGPTGTTNSGAYAPLFGLSTGGDATISQFQIADLVLVVGDL
jgi:hypothetical protein